MQRQRLTHSRRWVIKIGSALLTNDGLGLNHNGIAGWVAQMAALQQRGIEVVLVSSGAVAEGMSRLGWKTRPHALHELQAAAAIGQMGLVQNYETEFKKYGLHTAQILLTHDDLANRKRYLNARSTLRTLLELKVVPVVNENDTVVIDEIKFGDNDTLAALVANLIEADHLIILTDQAGLYDKNPREYPDARLMYEAMATDNSLDAMVSDKGGALGRGGMLTKLRAARLAARSATSTIIAPGREAEILTRLANAEVVGTYLVAEQSQVTARKQWLAGHLQLRGKLIVDAGAKRVLKDKGSSLLAVGVRGVEGKFQRGEVVSCVDEAGKEVARGLVNYNSDEILRLMGQSSDKIESILGYVDEEELIHRDNMIIV
ncbi:MAG: glutamate 5-kinase [Gammaproteobacteria bacterium]|nr:glutamate 5-kinase [Gammaproteobacteria bacterium]